MWLFLTQYRPHLLENSLLLITFVILTVTLSSVILTITLSFVAITINNVLVLCISCFAHLVGRFETMILNYKLLFGYALRNYSGLVDVHCHYINLKGVLDLNFNSDSNLDCMNIRLNFGLGEVFQNLAPTIMVVVQISYSTL